MSEAAIGALIGGVGSNVVVFAAILLIQLLKAPSRIHSDQERTIEGLRPRQRSQQLAEALSVQAERAIHQLWAAHPDGASETVVDGWIAAIDRWVNDTIQIMEAGGCSPDECRRIRVIGNLADYAPPGGRYHNHGRVNTQLVSLDARLKRLRGYIDKYSA